MMRTACWAGVSLILLPGAVASLPISFWIFGLQDLSFVPSGNKSLVLGAVLLVRSLWAAFWFGVPAIVTCHLVVGPPSVAGGELLRALLTTLVYGGLVGGSYALEPGWFYDGGLIAAGIVYLSLLLPLVVRVPKCMFSGHAAA